MDIKVEILLPLNGELDDGDINLPTDPAWYRVMREELGNTGCVVLRLDNKPVDGSTGKLALTIGPAQVPHGEDEEDYLNYGASVPQPRVLGFLFSPEKLDELIAALVLMRPHLPPPYPATDGPNPGA